VWGGCPGEDKGILHESPGRRGQGSTRKTTSLRSPCSTKLTLSKGYHVQITARSDRDLTPEGILKKVADASGSKYSGGGASSSSGRAAPPVASKPVFQPTRSTGSGGGFNPLAGSATRVLPVRDSNVDNDGWGQDAPPVTRSQLEKVQPAYQPTKVNMRELSSQQQEPSRFDGGSRPEVSSDVVKGGYQPVGKVDIAALRAQAKRDQDDRPTVVKGAYEPVGKVDIAAIRAKAQAPGDAPSTSRISPAVTGTSQGSTGEVKSLADRSAAFSSGERLTALPKPKVANRFGATTSNFTGTKAPVPGGLGLESVVSPTGPPVGVSRTFADEGGKTPAQLWAEKKARQGGASATSDQPKSAGLGGITSPVASQASGGGEWKSGYTGKSWGAVQIPKPSLQSIGNADQATGDGEGQAEEAQSSAGGVGAIRDRFKGATPMGGAATSAEDHSALPPLPDTSSKPNAGRGIPIPGLATAQTYEEEHEASRLPTPPPQPRSPTPPTPAEDSGSPIRVAMPVSRSQISEIQDAHEEQMSPPPAMPTRSLAKEALQVEDEPTEAPVQSSTFDHPAAEENPPPAAGGGERALVQYDYEKAEDNEIELKEGEYITDIQQVDTDWWQGTNSKGETGLFPSNYVELVGGDEDGSPAAASHHEPEPTHEEEHAHAAAAAGGGGGPTATALYDYEAAEDNELSFPEGAKITNLVSGLLRKPASRCMLMLSS
jgi:hypothetical protein